MPKGLRHGFGVSAFQSNVPPHIVQLVAGPRLGADDIYVRRRYRGRGARREEIVRLYRVTLDQPARNTPARFNICPTDPVDVVVAQDGKRTVVPMRWGLIPNWWSKPLKEIKIATFNARAETVAEKPMFRELFERRRCLIPASGYYEWKGTTDGKQPYYFTGRDGQPITIAGLWDNWRDKQIGEVFKSCTMVITEANGFVSAIHDRMPVILEPKDFEQWERGDPKHATALMKPAGEACCNAGRYRSASIARRRQPRTAR